MATFKQHARIALWTFTDPLQVFRKIQATGTAWTVRWTWCALAAALGLALAWVLPGMRNPTLLIGLPLLGVLLVLLAACDVKESHTDSFGTMLLCMALWGFAVPSAKVPQITGFLPQAVAAAVFLVVMLGGLYLGSLLTQSAMNRSYLILPVSFAVVAGTSAVSEPWIHARVSAVTGTSPTMLTPAVLVLVLFTLRLVSPLHCIGAFQHLSNTENCYALPLTEFKRRLIGTYAVLVSACLIGAWIRPAGAVRLQVLAGTLLFGMLLELDLPQLGALTLWLSARNRRFRFDTSPLVLSLPCCPFSPPGLHRYLERAREMMGDRRAAELAIALLLRTGYRRAAEATIEEIRAENPYLGFEITRRLMEAWPSDPSSREPAVKASPAPALTIPQLSPQDFRDAKFREVLFSHRYEPPRGKEGAPLAAWPLWFPVAAGPTETMTLPQIIYRSLASVREPFRRTRLSFSDPALAQQTYTELLDWAVSWARSSFGASVIPIALSLRRLADSGSRLEELCVRLVHERMAGAADTRAGCQEIIECGSVSATAGFGELAAAVEAGNAWILLEDDREGDIDLKTVKRALDLVFGPAGLSHAAILVVTAAKKCDVLSDVQSFRPERRQEHSPKDTGSYVPGRFMAAFCRVAASWGSPSMKASLLGTGAVALLLLILVVLRYDAIVPASLARDAVRTHHPWILLIPLLLPFAALVIGYKWGLFYGSEEVRLAAVESTVSTLPACLLLLLLALPKHLAPGPWRMVCVLLAGLPGIALFSLSLGMLTGLMANVLWLKASVRIDRRSRAADLSRWTERYRVVLHVARHGTAISLPAERQSSPELPLLVSFRNIGLLSRFLTAFPDRAQEFRKAILHGLQPPEPESAGYSASSLILESLQAEGNGVCADCLRLVGRDCVSEWPRRESFGEYHEPSTTFTMNALEYAARKLCYLTNLEDIVVVR